jgi:hypothetical protein
MQRRFQIPVLVAAVLILPVVVIEQSTNDESLKTAAQYLNWAIWLVFAAELRAIQQRMRALEGSVERLARRRG